MPESCANTDKPEALSPQAFTRYARHLAMMELGVSGQLKLSAASVLIIGLGGLGSAASMYLAASGLGKLTLVDFDVVDESNLQRQVVHNEQTIGWLKVDSAKHTLNQLNSLVEIETLGNKLSPEALAEQVAKADVVVDCSDNFTTRLAINQACYLAHTPLVSGAALYMEGQLSTYDFRQPDIACYQCLHLPELMSEQLNCATSGVLSPVVGMIGSMQAIEAIKVLLNLPTLNGQLMVIDSLTMNIKKLKLFKNPDCAVCGGH